MNPALPKQSSTKKYMYDYACKSLRFSTGPKIILSGGRNITETSRTHKTVNETVSKLKK